MRVPELFWAQSELGARWPSTAGGRTLADDPATGLDEPEAGRGLAGRLARLPAAHPSARPGGDQASEDAWWRGESDIWWRLPDRSEGWADYDDIGGLDDPGELADADDVTDAGGRGETGGSDDTGGPDDAGGANEAGDTDASGGQGGGTRRRPARTAGRAPGTAGRDDGQWHGHGGKASGPRAGSYRPWFSPEMSGDPWFAAGPEYPDGG
jgi:hypothetical protein